MHGESIILASASPRRSELMTLAGIPFRAVSADIDETVLPGEQPAEHVVRLAREKAAAVAGTTEGRFFVGADTVVVVDGRIMGKPADEAEAHGMLTLLSGRSHQVITGFAVLDGCSGQCRAGHVVTDVIFKQLREREITEYIASGCPMDKAGAYAIQGGAVHFVRAISGSYTNVVGLPMTELYETLLDIKALTLE